MGSTTPVPPVSPEPLRGAGPPRGTVGWGDRLALVIVPAGVALAFAALIAFQPRLPDRELQVVAPASGVPGGTVGVRVLAFADLGRPAGPRLVDDASVRVALEAGPPTAPGPRVAGAVLAPSPLGTHQGTLRIPDDAAPGAGRLIARGDGFPEPTILPFRLGSAAPRVERVPRALPPLSTFRAGAVAPVGGAPPPSPWTVRVAGGTCVPEVPCTLLVRVGTPGAAISVDVAESGRAVELVAPPEPPGETTGVVTLRLRVHGPEASVRLLARRGGELVARRAVRLPVAVGAPVLELGVGPAPTLQLAGVRGRSAALVDVFRNGAWTRATAASFEPDEDGAAVVAFPGEPLPPGLWRIQVQVDRFELGLAASRLHPVVAAPGRPAPGAVADLLRETRVDPGAAAELDRLAAVSDPDAAVAYALAGAERSLALLPDARSNRSARAAAVRRIRTRLRILTAALFLLAGVWVATFVARRGLRATAEAARLLDEGDAEVAEAEAVAPIGSRGSGGEPEGDADGVSWSPARRGDRLALTGLVSVVALAFVAGALIVLALGLLE